MEEDEYLLPTLSCFKCPPQSMGPLNIEYNALSSTFILWNKYEIFFYENYTFDRESGIFVPDFQIHQLISSNNLMVCLDFSGNIHITSLKFKQRASNPKKTMFLCEEQGVLKFTLSTSERLLCLKLEKNAYYLCLHYLNAKFQLERKVKLIFNTECNPQYSNDRNLILLKCHKFTKSFKDVLKIFGGNKDLCEECFFIIVSFDRRILYGCILSTKMTADEILLKKIYTSPMEICDVKVNEAEHVHILISLTGGTLIRLAINEDRTSEMVHFNTEIFKCLCCNNAIIYTDGINMWRCENTFTKDIKFKQFLVKQIKDFVCFGDQVLCTTNNNLIYTFGLEYDTSYVQISTNEYCEVTNILNDSEHLCKIFDNIELNNKTEDRIKEEKESIITLSIANHSYLLDAILQYSIQVYESYEDVIKQNINITLTDDIKEYFSTHIFYLLIEISVIFENHKIRETLLKVLKDLKIHITLLSGNKVLKSSSIMISDELKNINLLIPLDGIVDSTVKVNIQLMKRIPAGLCKEKEALYSTLHYKEIILNSEYFIKSVKKHTLQLRDADNSVEDAIFKMACNSNKHLFTINNTIHLHQDEFSFYVKLPHNYEEALKNLTVYKEIFNSEKALMILQKNTSEGFLNSKNSVIFEISNSKVKVEIIKNGIKNNCIKVTCDNLKTGFDIRNFYSKIVYNSFKGCDKEMVLIRSSLYTAVENFRKSINECIIKRFSDDELKSLLERFQSDVFGALPL